MLGRCLRSVAEVVSQIVVADTGSTDSTADVAREFGATVVSVPWRNHFANARNAALEVMKTDWVLVLDADEELDSDTQSQIASLLATSTAGGYRSHSQLHSNRQRPGLGPHRSGEHKLASSCPGGTGIFRPRELSTVPARSGSLFCRPGARTGGTSNQRAGAATAHGAVLHSSLWAFGAGRNAKPESSRLSRYVADEGSGAIQ